VSVLAPARTDVAVGPSALKTGLTLGVVAALASVATALADPGHAGEDRLALTLVVLRTAGHITALGTIGCLVLALCHHRHHRAPSPVILRSASLWALCWAAALLAALVVEVLAPGAVGTHGAVGPDPDSLSTRNRWLVGGIATAASLRILAPAVRRRRDLWLVLGIAVAGLVPAVATGHGDTSGTWSLVSSSLLLHVAAVSIWAGGLIALVTHYRVVWQDGAGPWTVGRYSRVALACFVTVGLSGIGAVLARSDPAAVLDSRAHLALLVAKASILVLLGAAGATQRRLVLPKLAAGGPAVLVVVAVAEVVLMATAVGLAVTLTHTAS
jgi:putative copper export protein